jgi:hypothetical protein
MSAAEPTWPSEVVERLKRQCDDAVFAKYCTRPLAGREIGTPPGTRTLNPRIKSPLLYPVELGALGASMLSAWTWRSPGRTGSSARRSCPRSSVPVIG